ncbi:hypothetical protein LWI28_026039 [Acer negundo]|uniref:DUF4283 domain-containing protein n=1 Tax=Acer negundo TaxID=4023 RepID=A0AAD5IGI0_ACENE|nr:hypothetical protein LWI28_026039 [Acer negundo]
MPPKRHTNSKPRENQIDEVYECDVIAQLRQQVGMLTQQIVALTAQKWRPNPQEAEEESNGDEALFILIQHRQGEAVNANQTIHRGREEDKRKEMMSLNLERQDIDKKWLEFCAVGFLKDFSSVSSVNKRLMDRGFQITSVHLSGKAILWKFESDIDCMGFIKNRFFLDDTFISMEKWTDHVQIQAKPVWITFSGVPIRCWNESVFLKLGKLVGKVLLIEKDTLLRRRMDRGKMLISLHEDQLCFQKLQVKEGNKVFIVSFEKDPTPTPFD